MADAHDFEATGNLKGIDLGGKGINLVICSHFIYLLGFHMYIQNMYVLYHM